MALDIFRIDKKNDRFTLLFIAFIVFFAPVTWGDEAGIVSKSTQEISAAQPRIAPWGFDLTGMQKNTHPGDNFYQYANGTWQMGATVEANNWSQSPTIRLRKEARAQSLVLIHQLQAQDWPENSDEARFLNLYASYLDRRRVNRLGRHPIEPFLTHIASARSHKYVAQKLGDLRLDIGGLFDVAVRIDPASGRGYIPSLEAGDLLLGVREDYVRDDAIAVAKREAGMTLLGDLLRMLGSNRRVTSRVRKVIGLETALANLYAPAEALRDTARDDVFMSLDELEAYAPGFPWTAYFEAQGISQLDRIHVRVHENLPALVALFNNTPVRVWQDYMRLRIVDAYGLYLSDRILKKTEALHATRRGVVYETVPAEQRASQLAERLMPDVLGRLYMAEHFDTRIESDVFEIAEAVRRAFGLRIQDAQWLSPETKSRALKKLEAVKFFVGGPDGWNDYSAFSPDEKYLFSNVYWARQIRKESSLRRLARPADAPRPSLETLRAHVFFSPRQIGAYYLPRLNAVIIPAAYLQAPYYDPHADIAVNYGALGTTIGHELGHAFDDQGSKYDWDGQLEDWWQDADRQRFETSGARLSAQFATYEAAPGVGLNPQLTLGENMSDLAGLEVAYQAYLVARTDKQDGNDRQDLHAGTQRFLLGYAQKRRSVRLPDKEISLSLSDPHSPPEHRVNGALRNFDVWYEAFGVTKDHTLWLAPEDRASIW